ncbi:MAG: multiheme c-type cytochrome [Candidatus Methanoperedens sp.]|nr:multiheme c-type cytochrome [Candidatus Methanoperedens sp.]
MSKMKEKILMLAGISLMLAIFSVMPAYAAGDSNDGGNYIGPRGCKFCHIDSYDSWMKTNHSRAFDRLVERGETTNASCLPCHTTGWDSMKKTYKFRDVTCEVCHGSGDISNNIAENVILVMYSQENKTQEEAQALLARMNLTKKSMIRNLTSELCGRCHQGKHRPTYEEWNKSTHKDSLNTLKGQKTAKDACLQCMATEYSLAELREKPTLNTSTLGITCVRCHNVKNYGEENLLRVPKNLLCESCHTMQEAKPGSTPHHSQREMRRSMGGVDADTYIYQPGATCADCHRYTRIYNETGNHEDGITGHTFKHDFQVCLNCHEGFLNAEEAEKFVRKQQNEVMDHYNASIIKVTDAGNLTKTISGEQRAVYNRVFNASLFNIQYVAADKSKGAHNPKYAEELIHKAELKAENILKGKPEAAADIPGFDFVSGIMTLLLALIAVAFKNRK